MMSPIASLGALPRGERLARISRSPNFENGEFQNPVETIITEPGQMWRILKRQLGGDEQRVPKRSPPIVALRRPEFDVPPESGLRISWLGHSTTIIEIDGRRVLIDPVFGERSSPFQFAGPKRFHAPPLPLTELPALDAVVLTHDHYDHLDMEVIRFLTRSPEHQRMPFVTALGVGAHLERWGIAAERIIEL